MTIARRLWLAAAIIVLTLAISSVTEVVAFRSYGEVERLRTAGQAAWGHSEALLKDLETARSSARGFLLSQNVDELTPYASAKDEAYGHLERLEGLAPDWSIEPSVTALRSVVRAEFTELDRCIALQKSGRRQQALALAASTRGRPSMDEASALIERTEQRLKVTLDDRTATAARLHRLLWAYMLLAVPFAAAVLILTIRLVTGQVKRSTSTLQEAMAAVSSSAHPQPLSTPPNDEVGRVVTAFNLMVERLAREQTERTAVETSLVASNRELGDRERTMNLLLQTSEQLTTVKDELEFALIVQRFLPQILPARPGCLYVLDASRTDLDAIASWNSPQAGDGRVSAAECFAVRREQGNLLAEAEQCRHAVSLRTSGLRCVPLISQGEVVGVLYLEAAPGAGDVPEGDRQKLLLLSDTLGLALGNLRLRERLRTESVRDPLTNVFNRRFLHEVLGFELARAAQTGQPFSLMMLDIDHFKRFNDVYGHETGDVVLRELAETLRRSSRKNDIVCRWGGEEFLLVFPTMDSDAAYQRAELLREAVKTIVVTSNGQRIGQITVSAGIATYPGAGLEAEGLIAAADGALYVAKRSGRDRVAIAGGPS